MQPKCFEMVHVLLSGVGGNRDKKCTKYSVCISRLRVGFLSILSLVVQGSTSTGIPTSSRYACRHYAVNFEKPDQPSMFPMKTVAEMHL